MSAAAGRRGGRAHGQARRPPLHQGYQWDVLQANFGHDCVDIQYKKYDTTNIIVNKILRNPLSKLDGCPIDNHLYQGLGEHVL